MHIQYVGTWVNGQREGAGQLMHSNHKFAGNFKTDMVNSHDMIEIRNKLLHSY